MTRTQAPHICFLSAKHPLRDKRVFAKEAISMARAGFRVSHVAPDAHAGERVEDGVRLIPVQADTKSWFRVRHMGTLYRVAKAVGADCYHCNEPDAWLVGAWLKARTGARVVFDVHEDYPNYFGFDDRIPSVLRVVLKALMRIVLAGLSLVTDRFVFAKHGVERDYPGWKARGIFAENYVSLADATAGEDLPAPVASHDDPIAVHLGVLARVRGWPQMLDAIARTRSRTRLLVIGEFVDGSGPAFDSRVRDLGLTDRVDYVPWLPYADAYARLLRSHIGLILFQPGNRNHEYALPHKLFDYMLARLPVIAPRDAVLVSQILKASDCGVLVDPANAADIAGAIDRLASDHAERARLGANGRSAVLERYNWESEARKLERMYRDMFDWTPSEPAVTPASEPYVLR